MIGNIIWMGQRELTQPSSKEFRPISWWYYLFGRAKSRIGLLQQYYFRMLAQSYTPNLYTPPLFHNFFIILSPLFFATVSIPIRFEPRIHPPVEWEQSVEKQRLSSEKRRSQSGTCFVCPRPGLSEFRIKRKESDWLFCKEAELSQKVKSKSKNHFLNCVFRFYLYLFTAQVHACRDQNR